MSNNQIAQQLGIRRPTVLLWRQRFSEGGPAASLFFCYASRSSRVFGLELEQAVDAARDLLQHGCKKFVEDLAYRAFVKNSGATPTSEESAAIRTMTSASALINNVRNAARSVAADVVGPDDVVATALFGSPGSLTFFRGFFEEQRRRSIVTNNASSTYWVTRPRPSRARIVVHEGLHLYFAGATDAFYGELISGTSITGTDAERRSKRSAIINEAIGKNCP